MRFIKNLNITALAGFYNIIFLSKFLVLGLLISLFIFLGFLKDYEIVFIKEKVVVMLLGFFLLTVLTIILFFNIYILVGKVPKFFILVLNFFSLLINNLIIVLIKVILGSRSEDSIFILDFIELRRKWTSEEIKSFIDNSFIKDFQFSSLTDSDFVNNLIKEALDDHFIEMSQKLQITITNLPKLIKFLYLFDKPHTWVSQLRESYESCISLFLKKIYDEELQKSFFYSKIESNNFTSRKEVVISASELRKSYVVQCIVDTLNERFNATLAINRVNHLNNLFPTQKDLNFIVSKLSSIVRTEIAELPQNLSNVVPAIVILGFLAVSLTVTTAIVIPGVKWLLFDKWFNHSLNFSESGYWQKYAFITDYVVIWPFYQFRSTSLRVRDILGPSNFIQYFYHYWWTYGIFLKKFKPNAFTNWFELSEGELRPWPPRELAGYFQFMPRTRGTELDLLAAFNNYLQHQSRHDIWPLQDPQELNGLLNLPFRSFFWIGSVVT